MRNKSYNEIDNIASSLYQKNKSMINNAIEKNRSNPVGELSRIRNDWMSFGAWQMQNSLNNNYFLFGTGFGDTVGE